MTPTRPSGRPSRYEFTLKLGKCRFCNEYRELCNSHAIPNFYFRRVFRSDRGAAIRLSDDERPLVKSQDSGKDFLLCERCESRFNLEFDAPAIHFLSAYAESIISGRSRKIEPIPELFQFIASVVWRAGVSSAPMYKPIFFNSEQELVLRDSLFALDKLRAVSSASVLNLVDYTDGGFTRSDFRQLISCPVVFEGRSQQRRYRVHAFSVEGFIMNFYIPRRGIKFRQRLHYLDSPGRFLAARDVDVFSYEPIAKAMFASLEKERSRRMTFKF